RTLGRALRHLHGSDGSGCRRGRADGGAAFASDAQDAGPFDVGLWTLPASGVDIAKLFPAANSRFGSNLFYHSHCQQKTGTAAPQTIDLLRAAGFDVVTSSVECCGMAGGFW